MHIYKKTIFIFLVLAIQTACALKIESKSYKLSYKDCMHINIVEKNLKSEFIKTQNSYPSKVIILLNPLSIPSLMAFDIPGYSLMDTFAKAGYSFWGIDFIGQGNSSYPKSMQTSPAPTNHTPLLAEKSIPQLHRAIGFILNTTKQKKGCAFRVVMGFYCCSNVCN